MRKVLFGFTLCYSHKLRVTVTKLKKYLHSKVLKMYFLKIP